MGKKLVQACIGPRGRASSTRRWYYMVLLFYPDWFDGADGELNAIMQRKAAIEL